MDVKVSVIAFPDLLASSALLMLTVYHLMLYLGRRKDRKEKYNLYFAGFVLSSVLFVIAPYFREGYFLNIFRPHWLYVINIEMATIWLLFFSGINFFNHLLEVSSEFRKKFHFTYISISLNVLLTLTSNFFGVEFYFKYVLNYLFIVIAINVLLMNLLFGYWIYKERLYKEKFIGILYGGFLLLTFNMLIYHFIEIKNPPFFAIPSHYLTALILYFFAYAFSLKFNKEHSELKELKINLETRVDEQTRYLVANNRILAGNFESPMVLFPSKWNTASIDEQFLLKAVRIIENNINEPGFNAKRFSEEIGISQAHLYRKLKSLTNKSATEFIRSIRLKHAAELLDQRAASISEIAYDTGFNNLSYFTHCFKEEFGMVPSEYYSASNRYSETSEMSLSGV
jgi:AraC-like DNA-binding protein